METLNTVQHREFLAAVDSLPIPVGYLAPEYRYYFEARLHFANSIAAVRMTTYCKEHGLATEANCYKMMAIASADLLHKTWREARGVTLHWPTAWLGKDNATT
jgi:hypothetical protein